MSIKIGDFVKGKPESDSKYTNTNSAMTRGVVVKTDSDTITVKILEHKDNETGKHVVDPQYFEVIGQAKPFNRDELLELLRNGCKKAILDYDLCGANLRDANLRDANLCGANLCDANLRDANLCDANLCDANLCGANLCDANLCGANLRDANLCGANLCDANLCDANLRDANLCDANLCGANLCDANLCGANLCGANLCGANLRDANLRGADLCGANLCGANLRDADIDFSCMPLKCGGLKWRISKRIACQLVYHVCSMQCDDEDFIKIKNFALGFANQFHRVNECGELMPIEESNSNEE